MSRAVGGAVTRNRTRRRLRAVAAERLAGLPAGVDLVVRARPDAATATYAGLTEEVGSLLERVASRALSRSPRLSRAGR